MTHTHAGKMLSFIEQCPSPYHTIAALKRMLDEAGYTELDEQKDWEILPNGKYYVTRNLSSLIAFRMPAGEPSGLMMSASHSDSPTFKIKNQTEMASEGYLRLNVERYGGMLCATWLDRPLSVAGKILCNNNGKLISKLVYVDKDVFLIPNVAIHMNRAANDGFSYKANIDMIPLFGSGSADSGKYAALLAEAAGVKVEDIVSTDLFLVNRMPGSIWGANEEYFSSPRLDDLECVYGTMTGLIGASASDAIALCAVLDNEEVGSTTKQGADSTFLSDTVDRIADCLVWSRSRRARAIAQSFMVSADNAHAVHPNHPEFSDPTNKVYMNRGIVIKYNANQKYTTDAVSDAIFSGICKKAGVKTQHYVNRADMAGGSTLGNIANTHLSVNTVDIGLAQLAMHSSYETAGCADIDDLCNAMKCYFSSSLERSRDGDYEIH